jgi:hypothetical protein
MNRSTKLSLPRTLSVVIVVAASVAGGSVGCGGGTEEEGAICVAGPDAGPKQKCPNAPNAKDECPPGCEVEVV